MQQTQLQMQRELIKTLIVRQNKKRSRKIWSERRPFIIQAVKDAVLAFVLIIFVLTVLLYVVRLVAGV